MYAIGSGWNRWATVTHGVVGVAVVAVSPWKSLVVRRGVRRRGHGGAAPALALTGLSVLALATGFAHRAGVRELGPVLAMQLHVGAALAAVPLLVWHVVRRPVRPRRVDLDRRALLRGSLLAGGSTVVALALPHAGRGATRSLERGSYRPDEMPVTQWLADDVPDIDPAAWRLAVGDGRWSLDALEALGGEDRDATLDCTGGWFATQRWTGVPLDRLLREAGVGPEHEATLVVRSATGYERRFPRADASRLLLAVRVGGARLSPGHGFPARVVAPGRRGFWWVKWVTEVRVDDRPWWWQPPFPTR